MKKPCERVKEHLWSLLKGVGILGGLIGGLVLIVVIIESARRGYWVPLAILGSLGFLVASWAIGRAIDS